MAEADVEDRWQRGERHGVSEDHYPGHSSYPLSDLDQTRKCPNEEDLEFPCEEELRLVLLGKTGSGKSSTGNTILGEEKFKVGHGSKSATTRSWWKYGQRFGKRLEIVDTPGFFDTEMDGDILQKEIVNGVGCTAPGPHAILFVVRADIRFTTEEANVLAEIRNIFGENIMRHIITVFTHGDRFESYEAFLDQYLADPEAKLGSLLRETDQRFVLFNNVEKNPEKRREQVKQLLVVIRGMLAKTDNKSFQNPMYLQCEEIMLTNTEELRKKLGDAIPKDSVGSLLHAALMGEQNSRELIHQILDTASREKAQLEREKAMLKTKLYEERTAAAREKADIDRLLEQALEQAQKAQKELSAMKIELEEAKKKKKWCVLL